MTIKLYGANVSFPVRAVFMTAKAIGLNYEFIDMDLYVKRDQLKPEYLKINPQHTVPTLDDDGFIIWDSHAIVCYLVSKYASNDDLYPKDLKKRAIVDRLLHFDSGIVFPRALDIFYSIIFGGLKTIPQEKKDAVYQAYDLLEIFLQGNEWVTGNQLTIADFCLIPVISSLEPFVTIDPAKYPRITSWLNKSKQLPYYQECNQPGVDKLTSVVNEKLAS